MQLVQLIIPSEAAHPTVRELGEIGLVQFKDLNPEKSAFQRAYALQVKRCDEMARKLRFFKEQLKMKDNFLDARPPEPAPELDALEIRLEELEKQLMEVISNNDRLKKSHAELVELQIVLEKASCFFDEARSMASTRGEDSFLSRSSSQDQGETGRPLLEGDSLRNAALAHGLGYVTGVILQEKALSFERVLFRATRGNMFVKQVSGYHVGGGQEGFRTSAQRGWRSGTSKADPE